MLMLGIATADITPPPGSMMGCFPRGKDRQVRRSKGAHDPLQAKAVVLDDGRQSVAICACDLTAIRDVDMERIRLNVEKSVPALAGPRTIITCTHTHSSAETMYIYGNSPDDPWVQEMDSRIASAIIEAYTNREPTQFSVATRQIPLNHNRRVIGPDNTARMAMEYVANITNGPCDSELTALRFNISSGRTTIMYHFAAHALTVGPTNDWYTADFPGAACNVIETAVTDATSLFLNGAAGNVHPRMCMRDGFDTMNVVGSQLGMAVIEALDLCQPVNTDELKFATTTLTFEHRSDSNTMMDVELSCLGLGNVVMAFVPGEPFIELQQDFKRAIKPAIGVFVGYSNAWVGYIPDQASYAYGGYGVEEDLRFPDIKKAYSVTALPMGAAEHIIENLTALADFDADSTNIK